MIDIAAIKARIAAVVEANGATIMRTGASEKSDAIYINIRKPKVICQEYGVLESWEVLVRVSNHFNDTNTADRLTADFFVNICDEDQVESSIDVVTDFLASAGCETEEPAPKDNSPSLGM